MVGKTIAFPFAAFRNFSGAFPVELQVAIPNTNTIPKEIAGLRETTTEL